MDIDRIAIVLHSAVLKKLQNEFRIPETLTQEQIQAAYDRVYDILQQAIVGRDIKLDKIEIQKEATLRSIQEIPIAIRDATKELKQTLEPPKDTSEDNPSDIQNLVELELQKRGMQDQTIGAIPPPTPTPTPIGSEQFNIIDTPALTENNTYASSITPDESGSGSDTIKQTGMASSTQTSTRLPLAQPPLAQPPHDSFEPVSTLISSPNKGSDGLRWEFESNSPVLGITHVYLPHLFVKHHPYLLIHIVNDGMSMTHPLIHSSDNWYKVPNGKNLLGRLSGSFRLSITDPDGEVIRTRYTLKEAQNNHTFYTKAVIDPKTGIAHTFDDMKTETNTINKSDDKSGDTKPSPDDEVILLFEDHAIGVFFLISSV